MSIKTLVRFVDETTNIDNRSTHQHEHMKTLT